MGYEVIKRNDKFVCRDKKESGRRKTYLKSDDRKECIKMMRRLYLSDNRKKRGMRNKSENKKNIDNIDECKKEEKQ